VLAYLAYPATQWNALDPNLGFHPVSLALPLLLYALWWLDEGRWVRFAIVAVLAAASNEQIAVIVGCLGLWYSLTRKRPVFGASLFATGLAITVVDFLIVPHFSTTATNPFTGRYVAVGGTAGGILKTHATAPSPQAGGGHPDRSQARVPWAALRPAARSLFARAAAAHWCGPAATDQSLVLFA
jgi:hypothetical protein